MTIEIRKVSAIVLAAGASSRMGQPKLVLPWGNSTVIGHVIEVLSCANLVEILVVLGESMENVKYALSEYQVRLVINPASFEGEMLSSVKTGLIELSPDIDAALIMLGDQPFVQLGVVELLLNTYQETNFKLIVPSYRKRRGHPWLVDRSKWDEILKLDSRHSLRDFLNENQSIIRYVEVSTESILLDLDTPGDYMAYRPK